LEALFATPWGWVIAGAILVAVFYGGTLWVDHRRRRPQPAPLRNDYIEGLLALTAGDRRRAEQRLASMAEAQPQEALVFLLFGALLTRRGEAARAARLLEGLLVRVDLDPSLASYCREELIAALVRAGRIKEAATWVRRLPTSSSADLELLQRRAGLAMAARAYDVAEVLGTRVERAAQAQGSRLIALSLAAQAEDAADAGDANEALKLVRRAIGKDAEAAVAWALEGELLLQAGKLEKARASFLEALKLEPRLGLAVFPPLEDAHMELGQVAGYEAMVESLLEVRPRDPIALWAIGRHWVRRNHLPEGIKALCDAVEEAPSFWRARRAVARARALQEDRSTPEVTGPTPSATLCSACGSVGVRGIVRCPVCGQVGTIVFSFAAQPESGGNPLGLTAGSAP